MINIPRHVKDLQPYKPGKPIEEVKKELGLTQVIKLASNENPLGASPKAIEAIKESVSSIHRYPDLGSVDLREKISSKFNLPFENIIAGSGSEGVLAVAIKSFYMPGENLITSFGSFIGIYVIANAMGIPTKITPMKDFKYDVEAIADAIDDNTKFIYIANPNNPTGTIVTNEELDFLISRLPDHTLLIMDEAYVEYANFDKDYPITLHINKPNVLTTRTFSKAYGISGIRVGFGVGDPYLISHMIKVKLPFEPSLSAQRAAIAALDDEEFLKKSVKMNSDGKILFYNFFEELGVQYIKSHGNFVCTVWENEDRVNKICGDLMKLGVIVRSLGSFGFPNCLRITIGTEYENNYFFDAFRKVL